MDILTNFNQINRDRYVDFKVNEDLSGNKGFCDSKVLGLRSYQRFPAIYLKDHRGILLDHGLGAGKTKTAVEVMRIWGRDVVILLPASLHGNFSGELDRMKRMSGQNIYYLHYNAGNLVAQYEKIGERAIGEDVNANRFSGKLIIIEEAHIFFQNVISGKATIAIEIFEKLMAAKGAKFLFLTGTPITGDPFELVPMFNLLRGNLYDEKSGKMFPLFPILREEFYKNFVSTEFNSIKNREVFQDRISGLVSYYKGILDPDHYILPKISDIQVVKCPMGDVQWQFYMESRGKEWDLERIAKYKTEAFKEGKYKKAERASSGTYKTNSAQACNFAFPEMVEKKYNSYITNYGRVHEISEFKWKLLLENYDEPFKYIYQNLAKYSGKLDYLIRRVTAVERDEKKIFIYTKYQILGATICAKMLIEAGYEQILEGNIPSYDGLSKKKRFLVVDGTLKDPYSLIRFYNKASNFKGEYCQIIIGTSIVQAGISLFDMREGYALESQWRANILTQVKGRMIRTCSHNRLPVEERTVDFYILSSVPPKESLRGALTPDMGKTTDEILYDGAVRKAELSDTFIKAMHEAAVDCHLNRFHNGEIDCRDCLNELPVKLIPADYRVHVVNGSSCVTTVKNTKLINHLDLDTGIMYKKDDADNIYEVNEDGKYEDVGYIKDGKVVLNTQWL